MIRDETVARIKASTVIELVWIAEPANTGNIAHEIIVEMLL